MLIGQGDWYTIGFPPLAPCPLRVALHAWGLLMHETGPGKARYGQARYL